MKRVVYLILATAACGGNEPGPAPLPRGTAAPTTTPVASAPLPADALGPKPEPAPPAAFVPPAPVQYKSALGFDVWLLERHTLPIVAVTVVARSGAAVDPPGKAGTAFLSARMLTEGAGTRGAIEFSQAVDALGADLGATAYGDYSAASLVALKGKLGPALALLGDAVVRPRFAEADFKRAKGLWIDDLKSEQKEPKAISEAATVELLFGKAHPYGHVRTGSLDDAPRITLGDVKDAHRRTFAKDRTTVVVAGDIDRATLDAELAKAFAGYGQNELPAAALPKVDASYKPPFGRVVIVDRPGASQAIVSLVAPGVAAGTSDSIRLARVNAALGGSFTSRLNQDLREERGLSYGASSRFGFSQREGLFSASAAIFEAKASEGIEALVKDVAAYAKSGPTDEEVEKTRLLARGDLVESFEGAAQSASRLGRNAGVGLPPDFEARASKERDGASKSDLVALAQKYMPVQRAFLLVVGPPTAADAALPKLKELGFEGAPIHYKLGSGNLAGAAPTPPVTKKGGAK